MKTVVAAGNDLSNEIGKHTWWWGTPQPRPAGFFSLLLDVDTIYMTIIVFAIILILALIARRRLSLERPTGVQNLLEMLIEFVNGLVVDTLGAKAGASLAPLAITLFIFILLSNWIGLVPVSDIPIGDHNHPIFVLPAFHSPTSDLNTTAGLALMVIILVQVLSIRARGFGGYLSHFAQPFVALAPLTVIEELSKPITLAFRLFGNVFAGEVLILVFGVLLPAWAVPLPHAFALALGLFVGAIQAFIFTMLTIAYIGIATSTEGH